MAQVPLNSCVNGLVQLQVNKAVLVGPVAYRLILPGNMRIHRVFQCVSNESHTGLITGVSLPLFLLSWKMAQNGSK